MGDQVQGFRGHRRLQRTRWTRREGQQGGGHRHPQRHHHGQAVNRPREARVLGNQARQASHCALQGDREVWLHLGEADPCSPWYWHRVRSCTEEAPAHGRYRRLLHLGQGFHCTLGNFAKATYAAIAETYSYLTPDLWKETVFTKSPYQEFTDFLAKNHRAAGVQKQEARAY